MTEEDDQEEVYAEHGILEDDITVPAYIRSEETFKMLVNYVWFDFHGFAEPFLFCKLMIYANIPVMHILYCKFPWYLHTNYSLKAQIF